MQVPFQVKSLFPYESTYEDDLNFGTGVVITVTSIENDEWYSGEYDGKSGMFPKNFVEVIKTPVVPTSNRPVKQAPPKEEEHKSQTQPESEHQQSPSKIESPSTGKSEPSTTHSIPKPSQVSSGSVPMPKGFGGSKPVDPYSIKKQFVAASTSSYVPKVQPRDDSNLVVHPVHETKHADFKSTSVDEPEREHREEIEESAPKMTLKERIAMIQKQQQEEAEREAAALKKKEERKKKQAAEREKLHQLKHSQQSPQVRSIDTHRTGGSIGSEAPISPIESKTHTSIGGDEVGHHGAGAENDDEVDTGEQAEIEEDQDEDQECGTEQPQEDEEEEEEDEDEKRRKLVERMAKIAGGRNMFGLPFGAPAAPSITKKQPAPVPRHEDDDHEDDDNEDNIPEVIEEPAIENEEETIVKQPIRLEKRITTDLEPTDYDADLSEAYVTEERKHEDDDEDIEDHHPRHQHPNRGPPPPPPPPTTREEDENADDDDDDEQQQQLTVHKHHHHHHHNKEAPPPPPPVSDLPPPPPVPSSVPVSVPVSKADDAAFAPQSTPPIPESAPPIPGLFSTPGIPSSVPPSIPTSVPPSIPTSAPRPPIPGSIPPPPLQSRHHEDDGDDDYEEEEEDENNDEADFEFVEKAPPVPTNVPRAQTLDSFGSETNHQHHDNEDAPQTFPKRSSTMFSHNSSRSQRSSIDSTPKRKSLELPLNRSKSLKDNGSVKSHDEVTSDIETVVPDLINTLANQNISDKSSKKVQLVLELEYQNGTLINHGVKVKSHYPQLLPFK